MIWKNGKKIKVCSYCGKEGHTSFQCSQKKIDSLSQPKKENKVSHSKKQNNSERSRLIHKLDQLISEYYRKEQIKKVGYNYCEICSKRLKYEDSCIGHLTSRRYIGTRFLPQNFLIICKDCNQPGANQKEILSKMEKILREKYDSFDEAQEMKNKKISTQEIELTINIYKNLLNQ